MTLCRWSAEFRPIPGVQGEGGCGQKDAQCVFHVQKDEDALDFGQPGNW